MSKGSRTRFGLDIDGVVHNWHDMARRLLSEEFGITAPPALQWDDLKNAVGKFAWEWLWDAKGGLQRLFSEGHSYLGAIEAVNKLAEYVDIIIISSVPEGAIYSRADWLVRYSIPCKELHLTMQPKSSILPHCDMYLDDGPHNITDLVTSTDATILVMDRPWNREVKSSPRIHRCQGWNDVLAMVR